MTAQAILNAFWEDHKNKAQPFNWLRGRSYSDAFVICVGAGPWKLGRRKAIQGQALRILDGRYLIWLTHDEIENMYPLRWQQEFVKNAVQNLLDQGWSSKGFESFCELRNSPCGKSRPGRRSL